MERRRPQSPEDHDPANADPGAIGGRKPDDGVDEAQRPVIEHGGGQAEGFEQAEQALIDAAEHSDYPRDPARNAYEVAHEARYDKAARGDADSIHSTEKRGEGETEDTRRDRKGSQ